MKPEPESFDTVRPPNVPTGASDRATAARQRPEQPPREPMQFTTGKAADVCDRFPLSEQASQLLTADLSPKQYLDILMDKNLLPDATRFFAHGLGKRDAVWWACLCLREALGANPASKIKGALEAAEKWAKSPNDDNRRAAHKAAETAGFGTPAGLTALAAFWSGGSMAPPDGPVVPPPDHMTAEAVAGAVLLAAVGAARRRFRTAKSVSWLSD